MINIKPIVERDDVKRVFERKLDNHDFTTSLDVKQALRDEGYWATQEKVTGFMREICAEDQTIDFDFNGVYREYFRIAPSTSTTNLQSNTSAPKTVAQFPPDDREPISLADVENGDWEVTGNNSYGTEFYKGILTPGVAKYEYSKRAGIPFTDVRVKRIQN